MSEQIVLSVNTVVDGRWFAAGTPIPFANEMDVPASLRPFIEAPAADAEPGTPTLNFQPGRIYDVNPEGAIITPRGRRQAAQLAGEASWQSACEVEAARPLDPETEAALQAEHDLRIGVALKTAELRSRDADAAVAAQEEGAEQKPAATPFVKRGAVWRHAGEARLRPGEPIFVKRPSGAWEAVGAVDASGGLPPPELIL